MTRNEAIDYLLDPIGKREKHDEAIRMAIEALERKQGKWLGKPLGGYSTVRCSVCRSAFLENSGKWNFCPNCGADMRGSND